VEGWSRYADRFAGLGRPDLALGFVDNALQLPLSAPDRSRLQVQRLLLTKAAEKAEKEAQEAEARETRPASAPVEPPRPVQPVSQNAPDSLSAALQALSQQAVELSNQGKQAEVLVTFERMLELSPSNPEALIGKAAAMLALGATAPALKFLDRLKIRMDLEPRRTYLEGLGAEQAGEYVRAVKALRSIVTSPRLSESQRALAAERVAALSERVDVMLASIEDIPDVKTAVEAYARLLVLHPKVAEAHRERGVGLAMLGRNGEALSCFDRAIALEPTEPKSYDHRAVTLLRIQQFDDVLKTLEQGIRHCPNSGQLHCRRGICLNMLGRKVDALAAFVRSLEVDPAHLDAWAYRGEVEAQLGRTRDAMVSLEKFLALRPSGEHKLVVAARRQLFALENPGRVPDEEKGKQLQRQALASAALGRIQDASDQLEAALRANPLSGELWCNRGTVLQQLDQPGEALVAFEMAEKLQGPISSVVRGEVACLSRLGRLDAALKCLDRELEATPLAEEAQRAKAMLLFRMGRSSESLEVYQLLVMRHPERVDFLAERAGVLEAVGKLPEARFGYEAALALSPASSELRSAVERLRQAER
jgi:tetratricopeptide (TPR) repeat protein